jgi:sugar phosphate isomerase/epimerase
VDQRAAIATCPVAGAFAPLLFAGDLVSAARAAAELGFEGIEVSTTGPEELSERRLRTLLDHFHLELAAIASGRIYLDERVTLSIQTGKSGSASQRGSSG